MSLLHDSQVEHRQGATVMPSQGLCARRRSSKIRVEIADGHVLLAHALGLVLRQESDFEVAGIRRELDLVSLQRTRPDVLVLGYFLMLTHGQEFIDLLRQELPNIRILVLTAALDEDTLACCVRFGTVGCVTKSQHPDELVDAVRRVADGSVLFASEILVRLLRTEAQRTPPADPGSSSLRPREIEVLTALAQGHNAVEIAQQMVISPHTVRSHLRSALAKLRARSRAEAIAVAVRRGMIEAPGPSQRRD